MPGTSRPELSWPEPSQAEPSRAEPSWPEPSPVEQAGGATLADPPGALAGAASSGSHLGMPIRVPQASLAPQLRDTSVAPGSPAASSGDNVANRSPDDIRSALSAMQRGWQQGREDLIDHTGNDSVASGHLPSGVETENTRSGDEGSRGGTDES